MAGIEIDGVNNKIDLDDDKDTSISANVDDTLVVEVGGVDEMTMSSSGIVINENSNDRDFRIESNGDAKAFFVDGGNDVVGIGATTPSTTFKTSIAGDGSSIIGGIEFRNAASGGETFTIGHAGATSTSGKLNVVGAGVLRFDTNNTERMRITSEGRVGVGTSSPDALLMSSSSDTTQVCGQFHATSSSFSGDGVGRIKCARTNTSGYEFLRIGSNNNSDIEFIFRGDGNAFADGSFSGGGADYAEYFEWEDGNSSDEDRRGFSVILNGDKIVKATDDDDQSKIIGIISGNPAVVGDTAYLKWNDKYLKDDFGTYLREEYTVTEWVETFEDEEKSQENHSYETDKIPNDVIVPDDATVITTEKDGITKLTRRIINPSYDDTKQYISRENRKEWSSVGLMGKLRLRKGQPTGTNWVKMRDISDTVEEWLVR